MSGRAKHWVWTLNNFNETEVNLLKAIDTDDGPITFVAWGVERGQQEQTPHLQGLVCLRNRKRLAQVKRLLGSDRIHLEVMRGTIQEALDYCLKDDGEHFQLGTMPTGQGSRSDLVALKNDIDSGKRVAEIADSHFTPFLKYHKGINLYFSLKAKKRSWETLNVVYWGRTGAGKTKAVHDNATDLYIHPGGQWFDGYMGQTQVLFDDYGGSEFKLTYFLKLLDRYPMSVPIKGSFVNWAPYEIYITSNRDPYDWYPNANSEHVAALMRRLSFIYKFD